MTVRCGTGCCIGQSTIFLCDLHTLYKLLIFQSSSPRLPSLVSCSTPSHVTFLLLLSLFRIHTCRLLLWNFSRRIFLFRYLFSAINTKQVTGEVLDNWTPVSSVLDQFLSQIAETRKNLIFNRFTRHMPI